MNIITRFWNWVLSFFRRKKEHEVIQAYYKNHPLPFTPRKHKHPLHRLHRGTFSPLKPFKKG